MFKEFKEFAMRGNVLDLAIGVIIGAAFGAIVNSLVSDILMPPLGMVTGGADFTEHFIVLNGQSYPNLAAAKTAGAPVVAYGLFLNSVINFLIVAFAIFFLVRQVNRMKPPPPEEAVTTKECPFCITGIPLKATRCPNCTSQLGATSAE